MVQCFGWSKACLARCVGLVLSDDPIRQHPQTRQTRVCVGLVLTCLAICVGTAGCALGWRHERRTAGVELTGHQPPESAAARGRDRDPQPAPPGRERAHLRPS
eukprot:3933214-Rhodomonas_salina.1